MHRVCVVIWAIYVKIENLTAQDKGFGDWPNIPHLVLQLRRGERDEPEEELPARLDRDGGAVDLGLHDLGGAPEYQSC